MMQDVQAQELSWLRDRLGEELETLQTTDRPIIHQFLAWSLLRGIERRAQHLQTTINQVTTRESEETLHAHSIA